MIAISGMGGQGKTALAVTFARSVEADFDCVIFRSLLNAPPLGELLQRWLRLLTGQQLVSVPDRLDAQFEQLFETLHDYRCLLVLDNVESIMRTGGQAGEYLPGYEVYGQLVRRFGESDHQSCLLLTSRELPGQFQWLEHNGATVHSLNLAGLDEVSGQTLVHDRGLRGADRDTAELVSRYSGNPLSLTLVADAIREMHDGNIGAFLAHETPIFDDIRDILDQQFGRLPALEEAIMYWLAIERVSASIETLRDDLGQQSAPGELLDALRSLQRRSLIEKRGDGFGLHNIVLEYTTNRLVERASQAPMIEQLAFLNRYALTKAQASEFVRDSQKRLILGRVAERLLDRIGRTRVETYLRELLTALQNMSWPQPGYAAGNILNLMLNLDVDCRGCDFSGLAV